MLELREECTSDIGNGTLALSGAAPVVVRMLGRVHRTELYIQVPASEREAARRKSAVALTAWWRSPRAYLPRCPITVAPGRCIVMLSAGAVGTDTAWKRLLRESNLSPLRVFMCVKICPLLVLMQTYSAVHSDKFSLKKIFVCSILCKRKLWGVYY